MVGICETPAVGELLGAQIAGRFAVVVERPAAGWEPGDVVAHRDRFACLRTGARTLGGDEARCLNRFGSLVHG